MKIRSTLTLIVLSLAATLAACDEETVTGPGFVCDVTNPVRDIFLGPSGATVLVHSPAQPGDTVQLVATATNRFGTERTDVRIDFSSSDETVATVDTLGIVHAKGPGTATIKASSCGESSSVTITVIASVASITVTPASDTIISGDTATVVARAFGPDNARVPNVEFIFSAPSTSVTVVQTSDTTAKVTATTPGAYSIQARGEGATGTSSLLVLARVFLAGSASATTIDVGDAFGCGIITLGQGFCWGSNNAKLGNGPSGTDTSTPVQMGGGVLFQTISAGYGHACGVTTTQLVYCWGANGSGQLGSTTASALLPVRAGSIEASEVAASGIGTGSGSHSCAIAKARLTVWCWGRNDAGQLGNGATTAGATANPAPVIVVSQKPL